MTSQAEELLLRDAMIAEAERLLTHPSVRSAYEHFITVSKLVEDYSERV